MSEFNTALREGSIKFGYDFMTSAEVVKLFGPEVRKPAFAGSFKIPGIENTLCWMVKEVGGNKWHNIPTRGTTVDGRGYRQIVSIKEYNEDVKVSKARVEEELANPLQRYVFWNEENNGVSFFKFHGVFELDEKATRSLMDAGEHACVYEKTCNVGECPQADFEVRDISADEFEGLAGKNLVVELLTSLEQTDPSKHDIRMWPHDGLKVKEVVASSSRLICTTSNGAEVVVPKRELELGYVRPGDVAKREGDGPEMTGSCTKEEFEKFWEESAEVLGLEGEEEDLAIRKGKYEYTLRCRWDEGNLVVAMASPRTTEWDYAQLYRGMFGCGDVDAGFNSTMLRKKVAKLLLDEILRRDEWLTGHPEAIARREKEIKGLEMPNWYERYRWTRNQMLRPGEGDLRLYVKGDNHLWGSRIHCEWSLSDLRAR